MEDTTPTLSESVTNSLDPLSAALSAEDQGAVVKLLETIPKEELGRLVDRLSPEEKGSLFELVSPEISASLLETLHFSQGSHLLDGLKPKVVAPILALVDSDDRADYLNEMGSDESAAILDRFEEDVAEDTRQLMAYPDGTAGSCMYREFLSFPQHLTVADILRDLQTNRDAYSAYGIQYAYILGPGKRLSGVLPARNLLFAKPTHAAQEIMLRDPVTVFPETSLEELQQIFEEFNYLGLPVVDTEGKLLGIVDREAPREAQQEAAMEDLLKVQGLMGKEELRSMPLATRSRRRLSWLSINIVLNLISASVIAFFQGTLEAVIALAVFLPIISDMSGCSGNQAVAVSMRELTLGLISPLEFGRVLYKESMIGLLNGTTLGILIGIIAYIWKGNPFLGLVVGVAMALNTLIAVCVGGLVPLLLKAARQDPALASGPILTTITDMCGFMLILGLATFFLPLLT